MLRISLFSPLLVSEISAIFWKIPSVLNFETFIPFHRTILFHESSTSGCVLAVSRLFEGTGSYGTYSTKPLNNTRLSCQY
jgi:hypothetical protein